MNEATQKQEPVIVVEPKYTIEVGHDRYQNLIIKKLKVSGDDLEQVYAQLQQALSDFRMLEV
jgi:hypothetical protein